MNKYLSLAIEHALSNTQCGHLPRMAAVLTLQTGGVFIGYNRLKTHPLQARFGRRPGSVYLHAEIDAIVDAVRHGHNIGNRLDEGASLYVARVLKNGQPALAKPCTGCQRAIMHFGIQNVEWTDGKGMSPS